MVQDKYGLPNISGSIAVNKFNPLEQTQIPNVNWAKFMTRTGVIARKIGNYPMWLKDGTKIHTTLLQVNV